MWKQLPKLTHFILPGGSRIASTLHLARTVCRRAERQLIILGKKNHLRAEVYQYLNRLK